MKAKFEPWLRLRQFKAARAVLVQQDAEREAIQGFAIRHRCLQIGNRDAAVILIGEAVDLLRRTDSVVAQAETLVDLAEVLRLAGRRKEADDVLEGAVELFEAKGNVAAVEALRVPAASS